MVNTHSHVELEALHPIPLQVPDSSLIYEDTEYIRESQVDTEVNSKSFTVPTQNNEDMQDEIACEKNPSYIIENDATINEEAADDDYI